MLLRTKIIGNITQNNALHGPILRAQDCRAEERGPSPKMANGIRVK